jgi:hypothetical protein
MDRGMKCGPPALINDTGVVSAAVLAARILSSPSGLPVSGGGHLASPLRCCRVISYGIKARLRRGPARPVSLQAESPPDASARAVGADQPAGRRAPGRAPSHALTEAPYAHIEVGPTEVGAPLVSSALRFQRRGFRINEDCELGADLCAPTPFFRSFCVPLRRAWGSDCTRYRAHHSRQDTVRKDLRNAGHSAESGSTVPRPVGATRRRLRAVLGPCERASGRPGAAKRCPL